MDGNSTYTGEVPVTDVLGDASQVTVDGARQLAPGRAGADHCAAIAKRTYWIGRCAASPSRVAYV